MKRFFLFFLVSVTLVGCSDDPSLILSEALKREAREKQEQSVQPGIEFCSEFDAAPVVPGESAETPIYFKSNLEWKAETTSSWFSISPKSGKSGDGSVVIKTQANEEFDTRSGKITFTSGYKTFTITVVQSPKSAIILEKDSFEVGKDGGTVTVVAKTTVGFEPVVLSDYREWIGVEPYTKALKTRYVQLNIAKNDGPERTGYVDLVNKEKGLSKRVSIKQEAVKVSETKTMADILKTTTGIPESTDLTPPANAWVNSTDPDCKAFVGIDTERGKLFVILKVGLELAPLEICMDDAFARIDDNTYQRVESGVGTFTIKMAEGKFISYIFEAVSGSADEQFNGTYSAPVSSPTFKAVYDTNGDANTLTFYYDAVDHSGEGIIVYDNLPTAANNDAAWGYNGVRTEIKKVVITESVKEYSSLTSTACMFHDMTIASSIEGAEYLDVSNVTDMNSMFESYGESSNILNKVPDVSGWKTGKVTSMTSMFNNYGNNSTVLADVPDVSNWNTVNVTNMTNMFQNYGYSSTALSTVPNVSGWNTSNVTKISNLFNGYGYTSNNIDCTLDLSGWNLSKITGNNGENVFNFNPSTFNITIPAKTGEKSNEGGKWYYGDGTNSIAPPTGKTFAPTLVGVFSVGATKKVQFSRGNLYWDGDSYEFEANQYTIGTWNAENHVNYFFWSKEESVAKAESYSDASAAASDVFFTNATTETAKAGFTVSGVTGEFRTLSAGEWTYILSTRANATDLLVEDVTVCDVEHCLVIAPDACLNSYVFDKTKKSYDAAAWATAEAAGLVCLPPAGYRDGTEVKSGEGNGFYWASTPNAANKASNLGFKKSDN